MGCRFSNLGLAHSLELSALLGKTAIEIESFRPTTPIALAIPGPPDVPYPFKQRYKTVDVRYIEVYGMSPS